MIDSGVVDPRAQNTLVEVYGYNADFTYYAATAIERDEVKPTNWYTEVAPPAIKAGYARVYDRDSSTWSYIEDHRGKLVYEINSKESSIVDYVGNLKSGYTFNTPDEIDASQTLM